MLNILDGECEGSSCLWHRSDERLFLSIYYKKYFCSKKYMQYLRGTPRERAMA